MTATQELLLKISTSHPSATAVLDSKGQQLGQVSSIDLRASFDKDAWHAKVTREINDLGDTEVIWYVVKSLEMRQATHLNSKTSANVLVVQLGDRLYK